VRSPLAGNYLDSLLASSLAERQVALRAPCEFKKSLVRRPCIVLYVVVYVVVHAPPLTTNIHVSLCAFLTEGQPQSSPGVWTAALQSIPDLHPTYLTWRRTVSVLPCAVLCVACRVLRAVCRVPCVACRVRCCPSFLHPFACACLSVTLAGQLVARDVKEALCEVSEVAFDPSVGAITR
jgi:hypothetical protein